MERKKALTRRQQYLQYIVPNLNDSQIDQMIAVLKPGKTFKAQKTRTEIGENDPYKELMSMVGCNEAKDQLTNMIAASRMARITACRGRKSNHAYYHAVFKGNPGCAKTTCARLYAKALAREGIVKKDTFAELTRVDLIASYQGQTAMKVKSKLNEYAGGVIFIDEAYSLCDDSPGSNNNYGEEAINEIVVFLENHPETVVIFAGYSDKMEEFLALNPGLRSRVPYQVSFKDYSVQELVDISKVIAAEKGYHITEDAISKLSDIYEKESQTTNFGNGRFARNMVEAAIRKKALTLGVMEAPNLDAYIDPHQYSDETLFSLDENCFEYLYAHGKEEKSKIGFLT